MIEKILKIAQEQEVTSSLALHERYRSSVSKQLGLKQFNSKVSSKDVKGTIAFTVSQEKLDRVREKINQNSEIKASIIRKLGVGQYFPAIGELSNPLSEGTAPLEHREGEILLILVWATWSAQSQGPIQALEQTFDKNKDSWRDKVRFVAVGLDEDIIKIKERVQQKDWKQIQHLGTKGWLIDHKLIKDFNIQIIPFACLVDQQGKIVFVGSASQVNLERKINNLIEGKTQNEPHAQNGDSKCWGQQETIKFETLTSKDFIQKQYGDLKLLDMKVNFIRRNLEGRRSAEIKIIVSILKEQQQRYLQYKSLFQDFSGINFQQTFVNFVEIPQVMDPICWNCNNALSYPYYWLKWQEEENKFGCRNCIEGQPNEPGEHYKYNKNSVLLQKKWERIDERLLGKNIQPQSGKEIPLKHRYSCNSCEQIPVQVGEPRYICLVCGQNEQGFVDACEGCIRKISEEGIEVNMDCSSHSEDHPFLRILHNLKGYSKF